MLHADVQRHIVGLVLGDRDEARNRHALVDIFESPAGKTGQEVNVNLVPIYWPGFASPDGCIPEFAITALMTSFKFAISKPSSSSSIDMFG
jgi:hypothetical protein